MPKFMTLWFLLFSLHVIAVPLLSEIGSEAYLALDTPTQEVGISSREVFDPPIISPNSTTVWKVGETVTVVWNITNLPPDSQLTNPNGTLLLGFLTAESENLMVDSPLAKGFKLSLGHINITVPSVVTRNNYIVALLGDSGNISPTFSIVGAASTSTGPTTTSTSTATVPSTSAIPTSPSTTTILSTGTTATSPSTTVPPISLTSPPVSDTSTNSSASRPTSLTTFSTLLSITSASSSGSSQSANTSAATTTNTSVGCKLTLNLFVFASSLFVFILNI